MTSTLFSMTGHGDAVADVGQRCIAVELRSVNHRHFKLMIRSSDLSPALETLVESFLRRVIARGSLTVSIRSTSQEGVPPGIHMSLLRAYARQLDQEFGNSFVTPAVVATLLSLPGVVDDQERSCELTEQDWPAVEQALTLAMQRFQEMRKAEGDAMAATLRQNCNDLTAIVDRIASRAADVVPAYSQRLQERLERILENHGITVTTQDLLREVTIYADRCDISEELVRLRSHLEQFAGFLQGSEVGRKLDFMTQEMFREANTIGSKANDAQISLDVVELKNGIEKMRELVQNVE